MKFAVYKCQYMFHILSDFITILGIYFIDTNYYVLVVNT